MKEGQAISALSSLAHQSRLRIVRQLITAGDNGLNAGAIGKAIDSAPSKVSFHLAALEHAGMVTAEKVSRNVIYRADFKRIGKLMNFLLSDCCADNPEIVSCCNIAESKKCCG